MLSFVQAIEKYGSEISDMMLEEEYNRFVRGGRPIKKRWELCDNYPVYKEVELDEKLYRMEEEF